LAGFGLGTLLANMVVSGWVARCWILTSIKLQPIPFLQKAQSLVLVFLFSQFISSQAFF